eukprot:761764-Rhodomonas_salina.1
MSCSDPRHILAVQTAELMGGSVPRATYKFIAEGTSLPPRACSSHSSPPPKPAGRLKLCRPPSLSLFRHQSIHPWQSSRCTHLTREVWCA